MQVKNNEELTIFTGQLEGLISNLDSKVYELFNKLENRVDSIVDYLGDLKDRFYEVEKLEVRLNNLERSCAAKF